MDNDKMDNNKRTGTDESIPTPTVVLISRQRVLPVGFRRSGGYFRNVNRWP